MRELRRILKNTNIGNFLPSETKIRKVQADLTQHLSIEKVDCGKMTFKKVEKGGEVSYKEKPYIRVKKLIPFINEIVNNIQSFRQDEEFECKIWVLFSVDKGRNSMKFHLEIINDSKSGSRDVVHPFALYEASDSIENLWKVFSVFQTELKKLQEPDFILDNGKKVKIFLGGDYDYISKCLGHQGQGATYPSPTDLVTLSHLRNHTGKGHNKKDCDIPMRDIHNYQLNYAENLRDDRVDNLRTLGKEHNSVINGMLFPISTLRNVVPSILHIHLGIV